MARYYPFKREDVFPSFFANRLQDFLSGVRTDLRLRVVDDDTIEVVTDLGIAAVAIQGRWRFIEAPIKRDHPGGSAGTYYVWAVSTDNDVDNEPDPFTDHTDYAFDLRITPEGVNPSGAGVEIFKKIGELSWSGAKITSLAQTHGWVFGSQIAVGALSNNADVVWTREQGGGWLANVKENAIGPAELADNSVDSAAIVDLAVITAKVAALAITEGKLAESSVATSKIVALAVTTAKLAAESVTSEKLALEAVTPATIQKLAVTTAKLAVESVTGEKIGPLAISEAKLAAEAVGTGKIKNLAVTAAKLAEEAVSTIKIANLAVTAAKIAELAITEAKLTDGAVTSRKFKPTSGVIYSTGDLELTAAYASVPGGLLTITPAVPSIVLITATFDLEVGNTANLAASGAGSISVDGAPEKEQMAMGGQTVVTSQQAIRSTFSQSYRVELSAAKHEIRLRAKALSGGGSCRKANTSLAYLVHSA